MNHFLVNGREVELPAGASDPNQGFSAFMEQVRRQFNSEASVIASIRVDGDELDGEREEQLSALPLSEIGSIELFTAHPREIAEETLQNLLDFTSHLEQFSRQSAEKLLAHQVPQEFMKLIDGIEIFTGGLVQVRMTLRIGRLEPVSVLEADLLSILKDLVEFTESGDRDYVIDLLQNHLPLNLEDWRREGIPALIRSRDS